MGKEVRRRRAVPPAHDHMIALIGSDVVWL
jgi:hypothetical protein